jgi:hypothetical protein
VLEIMGIQGRTYTIKGSADLKECSEPTFEVEWQECKLENVRAEKVQNYRVTILGDEPGATTKFYKLMVQ